MYGVDVRTRYRTELVVASRSGSPFEAVRARVGEWLESKGGRGEVVEGVRSLEGRHFWAACLEESEPGFRFRRWRTDLAVEDDGETATLRLCVSTYTLPGYFGREGRTQAGVPRLVRELVDDRALRVLAGGAPALMAPRMLDSQSVVTLLVPSIGSPARDVPIVVSSADDEGHYPVDPNRLARELLGMAFVLAVDRRDAGLAAALDSALSSANGHAAWRIEPDALYVFRPGAATDLPDAGRNWFRRDFLESRHLVGDAAVAMVRDGVLRCLPEPSGPASLDEVELEHRRAETARRLARAQEAAGRRAAPGSPDLDVPEAAGPTSQPTEPEDGEPDAQTGPVGRASDEETWASVALEESARADEAEARASQAEAKATSLQAALERRADGLEEAREAMRDFPSSLPSILDAISAQFPERIVFLPEARRSAEAFEGGSLEEEWRLVRAAADELWDVFMDDSVSDKEAAFKERTGIELAMTESGTTQAMPNLMRLRERQWEGRTISCVPHLKGKAPKVDPLRLYFHFDRERQKVVVGHVGAHLETAGTSRM